MYQAIRNYNVSVAGSAPIFGCNEERWIYYKDLVLRISDLKTETNPASETLLVFYFFPWHYDPHWGLYFTAL